MKEPLDTRAVEIARGLTVKRRNAIAALLSGGVLTFAAAKLYGFGTDGLGFVGGLVAGVLYANAYEYVLHRFLLHWGNGFLVQRHALHHNSTGAPEEARYVNFASSPLVVVLLLVGNALPFFLLEYFLRLGLAAGVLVSFTIYYLLYEEIHWRFHMGGWLPRWMQGARQHHMLHHGDFEGRYNVFLPIFDWIFQHRQWKHGTMMPH
jgi:Fatty acid hydroxylase